MEETKRNETDYLISSSFHFCGFVDPHSRRSSYLILYRIFHGLIRENGDKGFFATLLFFHLPLLPLLFRRKKAALDWRLQRFLLRNVTGDEIDSGLKKAGLKGTPLYHFFFSSIDRDVSSCHGRMSQTAFFTPVALSARRGGRKKYIQLK